MICKEQHSAGAHHVTDHMTLHPVHPAWGHWPVDEGVSHVGGNGAWLALAQPEHTFDDWQLGARGVQPAEGTPVVHHHACRDDLATAIYRSCLEKEGKPVETQRYTTFTTTAPVIHPLSTASYTFGSWVPGASYQEGKETGQDVATLHCTINHFKTTIKPPTTEYNAMSRDCGQYFISFLFGRCFYL